MEPNNRLLLLLLCLNEYNLKKNMYKVIVASSLHPWTATLLHTRAATSLKIWQRVHFLSEHQRPLSTCHRQA